MSESAEPSPQISVVITAYNEAARIGRCLAALACQQGLEEGAFEVILVDDRSTDGTAAIAAASDLPNLRILAADPTVLPQLTTRQAALDLGIRAARGDVVVVLDADAILAADGLVRLVAAIRAGTEDVTAGFVVFRSEKGAIGAWQTVDAAFYLGICDGLARARLDAGVLFGHTAFRRTVYEKAGGFAQIGFAMTEDLAFARAALRQGARIGYRFSTAADVAAEPDWQALIQRARRVGRGAVGPLSVTIGLWMALLVLLALGALAGSATALALLAVRYGLGVLFVAAHLGLARQGRLVPYALAYEPVAIAIGLVVLLTARKADGITWGERTYRD